MIRINGGQATLGANTFTGAQVAPSLALGGATIGSDTLAVTGNASFASVAVASAGLYINSASAAYIALNGRANGDIVAFSTGRIGFTLSGTNANGAAPDAYITRDGVGILSMRDSTNAQAFHVYNTYTDASNYERTNIRYSANVFEIGTTALGTGTVRILRLSGGSTSLDIDPSSGVISANRTGSSAPTLLNLNSSGMTSTAVLFARLQPSINQASGAYTILDINPTETAIGAGPHYLIRGRLSAGANVFSVDRTGAATFGGALTVPGVTTAALTSTGTFTSGAGAQVGTLTNAPAAGNPTTWIKIIDNGVTRYIPAW